MKIYAYGIINSNANIVAAISGLEGAGVYNLSYRDIGVVISKFINQIKEVKKDDVLKHEEVIERLMGNYTVLPVRFFTTFDQEKEVLAMLKEFYHDFKENIVRLRNKVEFGIKVIWPADIIKQRIIDAYNKGKINTVAPEWEQVKTFVRAKFEKYKIDKEFQEEAERCVVVVDDYFGKATCEKKLQKLQTDSLLLNAAYLVEKEKQNEFKQAFEQLKSSPSDLKYLFSGPWPPYNFITLTKNTGLFDRKPISRQDNGLACLRPKS
ncbi:MAG: GvpL/GvpF family gas vesicle protein [Candidatus Omnitrophota bacterium]